VWQARQKVWLMVEIRIRVSTTQLSRPCNLWRLGEMEVNDEKEEKWEGPREVVVVVMSEGTPFRFHGS